MGQNEITGGNSDVEPLIEDNESHFWFRLLSLCKKRWKLLLPILLTLVIGTSILIGLFVHSHSQGKYLNISQQDLASSYILFFQMSTNKPLISEFLLP